MVIRDPLSPRRVLERLWALDGEYETLKSGLEDPKVMLTALKQQADLLLDIARLGSARDEQDESDEHSDGETALHELRRLFHELGPVIAG